jgi:DNA-binding CsgD family transcriptional regulator
MRCKREREDFGYSIERTTFGLSVRGWGLVTRLDAHHWARDMRHMLLAAGAPPHDVLLDVRGHAPCDHDPVISGVVRDTMAWCQAHGARRSAVVSDDPRLLLLTRGLARQADGAHAWQRSFNALHNPRWRADAMAWLATGEEAHWLRPEEARAELLLLVDALGEAVALFAADGGPLRVNPALARQLGTSGAGAPDAAAALDAHPLGAAIGALVATLVATRVRDGAPTGGVARTVTLPDGTPWRLHGRAVIGLFGPERLLLVSALPGVAAPLTDAELEVRYGLTPRERAVARLVAGGATNPEVAEALAVRRATVRNHLSSALRKLGVEHRTQLAERLLRPDLAGDVALRG